ncbi:UV-damage endonuclease [Nannizzia gypsea CBS 118893]|uniref:UV-damage endonuclease n=1 Tax=Arthroderma gypseum (strain ATCC MYA-4604 / CBS 118893) TaxID=535722 RepID=E5R177_ARTGP|nr:UV-damage endonuclease [Nannizzia gypsea CBS 118893]EFQ98466.1 UV-damage endonuclease [Nannizzia gypsea CBS 118893]
MSASHDLTERLEQDGEFAVDENQIEQAASQPPPVNSNYLPLPWKGRLGYACLNTYLRNANPPVFCSRTCRIASILENRHPLRDTSQARHPTKNRPDRTKPPDIARGQEFVQELGLANTRDLVTLIRWNARFGIRFMRISSEMFPFASHAEYGYKLAPFASEALAEVGKVAAELNHRLTVHPGQFTQLGSPRKEVISNSIRDLAYHAEMLNLLKLPPQMDRDAVIILHMGGTFGDKESTLGRFREAYADLPQDIRDRLVLENDDMSWTVHDLLPVCEELNIPFVLDYHHHNIHFDPDRIREGTLDIMSLYDRIRSTWVRKGKTQKMHYSEPVPEAITKVQRRKHSPRVSTLPPCDLTMDLMIEAKDKEQAVFELMKIYKLPGFDKINSIIPHHREDERKVSKKTQVLTDTSDTSWLDPEEMNMGGPYGRVYWPPGMEEWLRPQKRRLIPKVAGKTAKPQLREAKKKQREPSPEEESEDDLALDTSSGREQSAKRQKFTAKNKVQDAQSAERVHGRRRSARKSARP